MKEVPVYPNNVPGLIVFPGTLISPRAGNIIDDLLFWLSGNFDKLPRDKYSKSGILFEIWIFMELEDFVLYPPPGERKPYPDGVGRRVGFSKKYNTLSISYHIPGSFWINASPELLKSRLSDGIRQCFERMVAYAEKRDELITPTDLRRDFEAVMTRFDKEEIGAGPMKKTEIWESPRYVELKKSGKTDWGGGY